jgi:hypothetical protein
MMQVEEKPDVTYSDVGGCKEQIDKLREVKLVVNDLIYKIFRYVCVIKTTLRIKRNSFNFVFSDSIFSIVRFLKNLKL